MITGSIVAIIVAAGTAFGGYQIYDDTNIEALPLDAQVRQNADDIEVAGQAIQRLEDSEDEAEWLNLNTRRGKIGLTIKEYRHWCALGKKLFADFDCPTYDTKRPRND